jgi:hypothetical protein
MCEESHSTLLSNSTPYCISLTDLFAGRSRETHLFAGKGINHREPREELTVDVCMKERRYLLCVKEDLR